MKYSLIAIALILNQSIATARQIVPRLENGVYAHIYTNKGQIIAVLDYKNLPMTVSNFVGLAEGTIDNTAFGLGRPFYTGSKWHRVIPGHVIQGGSPDISDRGSTGYSYPNEIYGGLSHEKAGMLGIANAGPHTNGSQFYITLGDRSYLDGNYTVFGEVVKGMDVVNKIAQGDVIQRIDIRRVGRKAERFLPNTRSFMKMVAKAKAQVVKEEEQERELQEEYITSNYPDAVREENEIVHYTLKEGSGNVASAGTTIKVKYRGEVLLDSVAFVSTADGTPLDNPEAASFDYTVGTSKINKGLDWVLAQMKPGEKRIVILPIKMGYGPGGAYGPYKPKHQRFVIGPNTRLLYEIEVLCVND